MVYAANCPILYNAALGGAIAGILAGRSPVQTTPADAGLQQAVTEALAFAAELDGTVGYGGGQSIPSTAPSRVLASAGATVPPTTAAISNCAGWAGPVMSDLCRSAFEGRGAKSDGTATDYTAIATAVSAQFAAIVGAPVSLL